MQAVILAAGRGTRMKELTEGQPKPLLEVAGKPLLQHEFDALPDAVDEVIVVVGYLGSKIQERIGGSYSGKRVLYVEQDVLDGTAGALWRARDLLKDRFLVLMSDDLYAREDMDRLISLPEWGVVLQEVAHMRSGGNIEIDSQNAVVAITEGEHEGPGLMNTNLFIFDTRIFQSTLVPKSPGSEEYGLPQTAIYASQHLGIAFTAIPASFWFQITAPEDLKKAEAILHSGI